MPDNDNTPPKEKELAEKKLSEIKEPTGTNSTPSQSEKAPTLVDPTKPPIDTTPLQTTGTVDGDLRVKKRRWFNWGWGKKTKIIDNSPSPKLSEAEILTQAGEAGQVTTEALLKIVDEKIQQVNGEELVVIKIKKSLLLTVAGIMLLAMWITPLLKTGGSKMFDEAKDKLTTTLALTKKPVAATKTRIRMRTNANTELRTKIVSLINGVVDADVEVVEESITPATESAIVTKDNNKDLAKKLEQALGTTVKLSTNKASLTNDSQVDATIFIGSESAKLETK